MKSIVKELGEVNFPSFEGEQYYMIPFFKRNGLPKHMSRWQETVDQMLVGVETDDPIYIMIDQGLVKKETSHRRPGVHIDGFWIPDVSNTNSDQGIDVSLVSEELREFYQEQQKIRCHQTHITRLSAHGMPSYPGHTSQPVKRPQKPIQRPKNFEEAIILASNIRGCVAYTGDWHGEIGTGGDCSHIDLSGLDRVELQANKAYVGNVAMLHESVPLDAECYRTLVRLNVPGFELQ